MSILIIGSAHLYAQPDTSRFYAGFSFSTDYCYRTLILKGSDEVQFILDHNNDHEIPKFGLTTGAAALWKLNRYFEVSASLLYSNKGYQTRKLKVGMSGIDLRSRYNYHCLDIPLGVNFVAGKKRLQFVSSLGISANIFLVEIGKSYKFYETGEVIKNKGKTFYDYRRLWITAEAGIGVKYDLSSRLQLRILPSFRYGITTINDAPIVGRLWSAGIVVASYFRL